ncbi:MAG: SRPBCC domain-containing protein [Acidobacteriaceae bacterium]
MSTATESKTLQVTRSFTVGPERVFDAWLNPEMARRFLFSAPTGEMVRVEIDARVGGKFLIVRRTDGDDVEHVGEYLAIERPRRLVFTFGVPKFSTQFTQVTIEIAPTADGCTLTLTHEGVLPEWAERTQEGWGMILNGLDDTLQQSYATLIAPDTILLERLLPGPIERVWEYIADSEKRGKWLGTGIMDPKAGTTFTLYLRNSDLSTVKEVTPPQHAKHDAGYHTECRMTQCEPPTALSFIWDKATEMTIRLSPEGENVLLRLTHRQLTGTAPMHDFAAAWHTHLGFLVAHLNGRDPGSFWQAFSKNEAEYAPRGPAQQEAIG